MKKIIFFLVVFLGFYQGAFASGVFVADYGQGRVSNVTSTGLVSATYTSPSVWGVDFDGTAIYTANQASNFVSKIVNGVVVATGSSDYATTIAYDDSHVYVGSLYHGTLKVYDKNLSFQNNISVGSYVADILNVNGTIWIANAGVAIVTSTGYLNQFTYGNTKSLVFDGTNVWAGKENGSLLQFSLTGVVLNTFSISSRIDSVAFDGTSLWVANYNDNNVKKVSLSGSILSTVSTGTNPEVIAFDGTSIWVARVGGGSNKLTNIALDGTVIGSYNGFDYPYGIVANYIPPTGTCSDGIQNQNETSVDYGGVCACYVKDVESGKTLLPYRYTGIASSVIDDVKFYNEDVYQVRTGYTSSYWDYLSSGFKSRNWQVHSNKNSDTGALLDVLTNLSGAYVHYGDFTFNPNPVFTFTLYSSASFGNLKTADLFGSLFSTGSNTINYLRLITDKPWHLEAKVIKNLGTSTSPNNVEDSDYTRFESSSGSVFLPSGQVTQNFKIVFDEKSPFIFGIDWGSYTRSVSQTTVCDPVINKVNTYANGQVTSYTGQVKYVTDVTNALSTAVLNHTGAIVSSEFECPQEVLDVQAPGLSWTSWGFSKHVPVLDFDINAKPFGMLECPLKTIYLFTSKFQ